MTIATSNNRKSGPGTAHRCLNTSYAATLLCVVLTLTGCAVGPHYVKPAVSVNPSWRVTGSPQISAQPATESAWWKAFNDPVLEQLIQLAYKQNLTLRVAGLRIMEARAALAIATGNQYPQVQQAFAGVNGVGLSNNTVNKTTRFSRYFAIDNLGLDVSWEADFWRQYAKAVKAQKDVYLGSSRRLPGDARHVDRRSRTDLCGGSHLRSADRADPSEREYPGRIIAYRGCALP